MAIRYQVTQEEYAANPAGCVVKDGAITRTTHEGKVVSLREMNGYSDSDFYCTVQEADGSFREIEYSTTRCYCTTQAWVDATPEVLDAYKAMLKIEADKAARIEAERRAKLPTKGKNVKVVKGRKLAHGTEGRVFWYGESKFGGYTVGMELNNGEKVFTNASNVEVLQAPDFENFQEI